MQQIIRSNRSMMKRLSAISTLLVGFLVLLIIVGCAAPHEKQANHDTALVNNTLRVGTTGDFMPFSYRLPGSGELHGVDIAFARQLGDAMGVDIRFVETTWPSLIDDLLANKFDIGLSGITITPERLQVSSFSRPIMTSGKVAITRDENTARFNTLDSINHPEVRVIVNPGGTNEMFAREFFPRSTILLNEENITVFDKIISGAADVMVTDAVEAAVQESIHPELSISNRDAPFNSFQFGILLRQGSALKAHVNSWLAIQLEKHAYRRLFEAELLKIEAEFSVDRR